MPRAEHDLLGSLDLPDDALYGIQTERARRHFSAAGRVTQLDVIRALAEVKQACALANRDCGFLSESQTMAIVKACAEILSGAHDAHFVVDALQGGAGTSTNMNVNEVVAHRATQLAGEVITPLDHVNRHQSTNDTYPTAIKIAVLRALADLEKAIIRLQEAYQIKEREFAGVVKLGRTQLRDAVPVTLGREFGACATALARDRWRVFKCAERLRVVNLGGTAVGTGLAAPRAYIFCVIEKLREVTGLNLARAENLVDATQHHDAFVEVSGMVRAHAVNLIKFARDLRLMNSGPVGGLGEIELPAIQPGSTLMPGKINPVIPEMVMQAGFRVCGCDHEVTLAILSGELELNAFLPLVADALLTASHTLQRTDLIFAEFCVLGIRANADHCREVLERSHEIVTALVPVIGHEKAVQLAQRMRERPGSVREAVLAEGLMSAPELDALLQPEALCKLGF